MIGPSARGHFEVRYEPNTGFICVSFGEGKIGEAAARLVADKLQRHHAENLGRPLFILIDGRHATGIDAEARNVFSRLDNTPFVNEPRSYIGVFGGSLAFRTVARLFIKALMLLSNQTVMTLEASEPEARVWLTKQRADYLARRSARQGGPPSN